jgi:hypothetical protein
MLLTARTWRGLLVSSTNRLSCQAIAGSPPIPWSSRGLEHL